jgi:acyl carrier protein
MLTGEAEEWLKRAGIDPLPPDEALDMFVRSAGASGHHIVAAVDWPRFLEVYEARRRHPFFARIGGARDAEPATRGLADRVRAEGPQEGRRSLVSLVRDEVSAVLRLDADDAPAPHQGFFSIGFDSLMAIELKNRLATTLGVALPSTVAFDFPSTRDLAEYLGSDVLRLDAVPAAQPAPASGVSISPATGDVDEAAEAALARLDRLIAT